MPLWPRNPDLSAVKWLRIIPGSVKQPAGFVNDSEPSKLYLETQWGEQALIQHRSALHWVNACPSSLVLPRHLFCMGSFPFVFFFFFFLKSYDHDIAKNETTWMPTVMNYAFESN